MSADRVEDVAQREASDGPSVRLEGLSLLGSTEIPVEDIEQMLATAAGDEPDAELRACVQVVPFLVEERG